MRDEEELESNHGGRVKEQPRKVWVRPELISLSITGTRTALLCKDNESSVFYLGTTNCVQEPPPPSP